MAAVLPTSAEMISGTQTNAQQKVDLAALVDFAAENTNKGTTGGTSTAYTLTLVPALPALEAGQRFRVKFNAANTSTTPTINVNGLGPVALKVYGPTGAKEFPAIGALAADMLSYLEYDGTDVVVLNQLPPKIQAGFISGLTLSNNVTDPTNDIDIATGVVADSTSTYLLALTGPFTKRLDAAWAAGSGNGGLDTGSIANTTYHVYIIRKDSDGTTDAIFSASASAPTLPGGYSNYGYAYSISRVGGAILLFTQLGQKVIFTNSSLDFNSGVNTTASFVTTRAPAGIKTDVEVQVIYNNSVAANFVLYVSSPDQADQTADTTTGRVTIVSPSTVSFGAATIFCRTNTSGQIRVRSDDANNTTRVVTKSFTYIR